MSKLAVWGVGTQQRAYRSPAALYTSQRKSGAVRRNLCVAASVLTACTLLALAMSHTMVLQHHYGQHLFGDDLAQGAKVYVRVHRRHGHRPLGRVHRRGAQLAGRAELNAASTDKPVAQPLPQALPGAAPSAACCTAVCQGPVKA